MIANAYSGPMAEPLELTEQMYTNWPFVQNAGHAALTLIYLQAEQADRVVSLIPDDRRHLLEDYPESDALIRTIVYANPRFAQLAKDRHLDLFDKIDVTPGPLTQDYRAQRL